MAGQLFSRATINFAVNTQNALQQITGFQRNFSNSMGQMKTALMGFIGYQGIKGAYNSITNLVDTAEKLNVPVEKMSQWANLFAVFGGSTEEATASLEKFDKLSRDLKFHSSGPLRELSAVLRTNLNNKNFDGLIGAFRSQWGHLTDDAKREVLDMLGADAPALRRIIGASNAELSKAREEAARMHQTTKEEADSILQMEKNFAVLKKTITDAAIPVLQALQPLVEVLRNIAMAFNDLDNATQKSIVYGFLGYELIKHLGLLKLAAGGAAGALAGLGNVAALGAIVAFGPGLADMAKKLYEVAEGTKTLDQAMQELSERKDPFGWLIRSAEKNLKPVAAMIQSLSVGWSRIKIAMGVGSEVDKATVLGNYGNLLNSGQITQAEYDAFERKIQGQTGTATYEDVLKGKHGFIPYANPTAAGLTYKNARGDVIQNINIYGVTGAEDMMDQFRTVAEQSITPLMGGQG